VEIIPAIDLQDGRCVRLLQGDFEQVTIYSDDPVAVAQGFADAGARRLHVVDLDASRDAALTNQPQVEAIIAGSGITVQVAGGIRSAEAAEHWFTAGAGFVVLGTIVLEDFPTAAAMARRWPGRILFAFDVKEGRLASHGWLKASGPVAETVARQLRDLPLAGVIYTAVERDGTLTGPDLEGLRTLTRLLSLPVYASGGVTTMHDLEQVASTGAGGAIIGRAIYEGRLDLRLAVATFTLRPPSASEEGF
jgi:phosphoribosylformimino-5-aminoimidazole carboxamide ribotide isomerase